MILPSSIYLSHIYTYVYAWHHKALAHTTHTNQLQQSSRGGITMPLPPSRAVCPPQRAPLGLPALWWWWWHYMK